jgi:trigger factor
MKVEVEDISKVEKRVEVEVEAEEVGDEIEEQYGEVQRTAQVKGFRPGKVPRKMVERMFKDYVHELVVKKLVERTLETALDRKGIKPVVEPVLDPAEVKPGEPYKYTVHVEVRPEVALGEYKDLEVSHTAREVTDADVEAALANFRESVAVIAAPAEERPSRADDQITAEITAKENGQVLDFGGKGEQEIELWRPTWIPGLAEQLSGRKAGDEVVFTATVPAEPTTPEKFRGKTLEFTFKVAGVKERTLAELGDDFARANSRFETLAALRDSIRERLADQVNNGNRSRLQEAVLDALVAKNPVEVPPTLIKREAVRMAKDFMRRGAGREVRDEEVERFAPMFNEQAKRIFEVSYLLEAVAKAENIEAGEAEVEAKLQEESARMGIHPDKLKARLDDAGKEAIKLTAALDKALEFLTSHVSIKPEAEPAAEAEGTPAP